jgi:hypothetical protein
MSIMITIKQNGGVVELKLYVNGVLTGDVSTAAILKTPLIGQRPGFKFGRGFLSISSQANWGGNISHLAIMPETVSAEWVSEWDNQVNRNRPGYQDPSACEPC